MSTDIKLSKNEIFKIIQSGVFLGSLLSKLAGPLMKVAVPLQQLMQEFNNKTIKNKNKNKKNACFWNNNFNNFK